jgi:exosortase
MAKQTDDGILEEFRIEFMDFWRRLPNKGFFLVLLAAWLALFHYLGNSTLGYVRTPSLWWWLYDAYSGGGKSLWESEAGFSILIPPLVLGLFWFKRKQLVAKPLEAWAPGLCLLGLGVVLHFLGYLIQQPRLSVIGLFTGIYGLMGLAWGLAWLRNSFFPFFLLGFCVPLGSMSQPISFRLQLLTCKLVEAVSHNILAIDILRQGTQLSDPSGKYQYEVAAACSGIRSLTATVALSVVLAFFSFRKWWKRALVVGCAFPLAVIANLLRMLSIIIAAELGGQQTGNYVHDGGPLGIFSLLPYIVAFVGLLTLEHFLGDRPPRALESSNQPAELKLEEARP